MQFSIIVPTYNRPNFLKICLSNLELACNRFGFDKCELIVTEDGDNNITKNLVNNDFPWAKWIKGPGRALSANRNNAIQIAKGKWIVCIDDDCVADENILFEYQNAIENSPSSLAFEGKIEPDSWDLYKKDMAECPINIQGGVFWGANTCVLKQLYLDIGGYDENFKSYGQEDMDMYIRLKEKTTVKFVPGAKVVHPVRFGSLKKQIKDIPKSSKNFTKYIFKHANYLGYKNALDFGCKQVIWHIKAILSSIKQAKTKQAFLFFLKLLFYVPQNVYWFIKFSKNRNSLLH